MVLSLIRPAVPTAINMNHLIAEVFSKHCLAEDFRLDNIEIVQRYDPAMLETMGYRVLLQQALANIIKNAQEAMVQNERCGGRLMILTEATPTTITIRISDNGPGIPQDIQESIFDLFFTSKGPSKGSGIGLHFTKEVIAKHGGTITVESQVDEGTVFEIRIPVRSPETSVETGDGGEGRGTERIESARRQPTKSAPGRVLVIDDEPGILDLLSDILVAQNHTVTTSADANDALEKIQSNEYDCIICDIRMPDVDGRELSQWVKEYDRDLYHRLVFITGDIFNRETDEFIRETGIPCLEKPFTTDQVHDVMQGVLARSNDTSGLGGVDRAEWTP
jgi:CheY-like chemotaxis protein/anti-sigma regulatory factor (Ser/Thr protein kinase)